MKFILVNPPKLLHFRGEKVAFFCSEKIQKCCDVTRQWKSSPFSLKTTTHKNETHSTFLSTPSTVQKGIIQNFPEFHGNHPQQSKPPPQQKHRIFAYSELTPSPTPCGKNPIFPYAHSKQNTLLVLNFNIFLLFFLFNFHTLHTHFRISFQQKNFSLVAPTEYSPTEQNSQVFSFVAIFLHSLDNIFNFSPVVQKQLSSFCLFIILHSILVRRIIFWGDLNFWPHQPSFLSSTTTLE